MDKKKIICSGVTLISLIGFVGFRLQIYLNDNEIKKTGTPLNSEKSKNLIELEKAIEQLSNIKSDENDADKNHITKKTYYNLENFGNTCFINAVIQALFSIRPFTNLISETKINKPYTKILKSILHDLNIKEKARSINTSKITDLYDENKINTTFPKGQQGDSHELMSLLLQEIESELKKSCKDDFDKFDIIFNGEAILRIGDKINEISLRNNVYNIEKNVSETFYSYFIDHVKPLLKQSIDTSITEIKRPPQCLIMALQRTTNTGKNKKSIQIQKTIDIYNEFSNDLNSIQIKNTIIKYNLKAMVVHIGGSLNSGHYSAYCKRDQNWFFFDDKDGVVAKKYETENEFDEKLASISENVYILFYELEKQ
ncbi:hypothetical protein GVAV_002024 [Gurleya vavrai]